MQLARSNWKFVEEYLKQRKIIILPVGATEQHGPNGLLGTDYIIAEEIANAVGDRLGIMVAPVIAFGMSIHHLGFPGSIALRPTTLITVIQDVVESLARHGFEKFFIMNGHGGNIASLQAATQEVSLKLKLQFAVGSWWHEQKILDLVTEVFGDREGYHGSASEISMTRYFYPESVVDIPSTWEPAQGELSWSSNPQGFRELFPDGLIRSDPSVATEAKGKVIFDAAVEYYCQAVSSFEKMV